ncbi:hypothetical protein R1sor_010173 [Riccia sorocarpa]|uniref:Probable magnesium transporter n=1 Tax=Riccia sorocarpa TaxID=122646 RepID=A0ABD3HZY4_9MARC
MGDWVTGAAINIIGSVGINFGTNLLKLGHNQREKSAVLESCETGEKAITRKPVTHFQAWRFGVIVFSLGNCLNFISFGFAAQSLLAALGSVQFVSNVVFAYLVLNETVTGRILLATGFIVVGNIFLVAFGNHQSATYTNTELLANFKDPLYLGYCALLVLIVISQHFVYKRGRHLVMTRGEDIVGPFWRTMVPLSYSIVSGAIGTHSVLFAKSLSILMRLTVSGDSQLDGFFTYLIFILFLGTASFWMARLNEGLAMFDAILIVPMLQIAWTFFSIFTGFIYFEEYQVFDGFRASMFALGMLALFLGMSLLAPPTSKGHGAKSGLPANHTEAIPLMEMVDGSVGSEPRQFKEKDKKTLVQHLLKDATALVAKAKTTCQMLLGMGQDRLPASSVFAMPMLASSRIQWKSANLSTDWLGKLATDAEELSVVTIVNT